MHYHDWMSNYAKGVSYDACDGVAIYAQFNSWDNVIYGYFNWFRTWSHYAGWESHTADGLEFLSFIGKSYCPPGFTQQWMDQHSGLNYAQYIVQKLLPEAKALLAAVPVDPIPVSDKDLTVTWYEFNRRTSNGESTITAYAGDTPKYTHKVTTVSDLWAWSQHFPNAQNCPVADTAVKVIPKVPDFGEKKEDPKPDPVSTKYVPFSKQTKTVMPTKSVQNPKYLLLHWTCGDPESTGEDTISWGASQGYTFAALDREGQLWQSVPTNSGGYHSGSGIVDSFECYGIETICAGKVEKINGLYVPWFAKNSDGSVNKARCINPSEIIYDGDDTTDDQSFEGYYQSFTPAQMKTLYKTALYFHEVYNIPWENVVDHATMARPYGRKTDVGVSIGIGGMPAFRKACEQLWNSGKRWNNI
jgi:hypothetical protein